MRVHAFPGVVGGDTPARQVERRPEDDDDDDQKKREVVAHGGKIAERRQPGQNALFQGQLPEGARLGEKSQVEAVAVVPHEDKRLAGCPTENREADDDRDQPARVPHAGGRVAKDLDVTGQIKDLLEDRDWPLEQDRQRQQQGQPCQEGEERVKEIRKGLRGREGETGEPTA
jgi:hypothetical protein